MESDSTNFKRTVAALGLIASCIAIFTFLTGIVSIRDILGLGSANGNTVPNSQGPTSVPISNPTDTDIPIPTSTSRPQTQPQNVDFSNPNVSITVYDEAELGSNGVARIKVLAGGQPLLNDTVYIQQAAMDIAGYWSVRLAGSTGYSLNEGDGTVEFEREPGDYAVWLYSHKGNWGIEGRRDGLNVQLIPISIQSSRVIEVMISLARLVLQRDF